MLIFIIRDSQAPARVFAKIFEKHNELDDKIEKDGMHFEQIELEKMKKEKLKLKDEAYNMIMEYKKEHNL